MPEPHPRHQLGAPDPDLIPDPRFWGPSPAAPRRHRRRRPPTVAERVTAALPSRDSRTAIAAVVAVLITTTAVVSYRVTVPRGNAATPSAIPATASTRASRPVAVTPRRVVVHVAGAVTHPGVVTLPGGDRVIDAIETAGGARPDANLDALNLAARLHDGEQVLVPTMPDSTTTTSTVLPTGPTSTTAPG